MNHDQFWKWGQSAGLDDQMITAAEMTCILQVIVDFLIQDGLIRKEVYEELVAQRLLDTRQKIEQNFLNKWDELQGLDS